eukprot:maker-scaffold_12-snap-gene-6.40-mRNA-1 protein AED:0.23 eAED:0.23 QI:120/1/1/1/1/1/2/109/118
MNRRALSFNLSSSKSYESKSSSESNKPRSRTKKLIKRLSFSPTKRKVQKSVKIERPTFANYADFTKKALEYESDVSKFDSWEVLKFGVASRRFRTNMFEDDVHQYSSESDSDADSFFS